MSALESKKIVGALTSKGFEEEPGGDHRRFRLLVAGKATTVCTRVSRGKKSSRHLGDDLVGKMAFQMKLTRPQLKSFVDCSMSENGYLDLLSSRGVIE